MPWARVTDGRRDRSRASAARSRTPPERRSAHATERHVQAWRSRPLCLYREIQDRSEPEATHRCTRHPGESVAASGYERLRRSALDFVFRRAASAAAAAHSSRRREPPTVGMPAGVSTRNRSSPEGTTGSREPSSTGSAAPSASRRQPRVVPTSYIQPTAKSSSCIPSILPDKTRVMRSRKISPELCLTFEGVMKPEQRACPSALSIGRVGQWHAEGERTPLANAFTPRLYSPLVELDERLDHG